MTAHGVLMMPYWLSRMNVGITRAVSGTMTEPRMIVKIAERPRNRYLANPYPARMARIVAPMPPANA